MILELYLFAIGLIFMVFFILFDPDPSVRTNRLSRLSRPTFDSFEIQNKEIPVIESTFSTEKYYKNNPNNEEFVWKPIKNKDKNQYKMVMFINQHAGKALSYKGVRVILISEPPDNAKSAYSTVKNHYSEFDLILTFHAPFVNQMENAIYYNAVSSWVSIPNRKKHEKTKFCSYCFSKNNKRKGHKLRHQIVNKNFKNVDGYGPIVNKKVVNKAESLVDYKYHISVENCISPGYFSEKLIDCFVTYSIPIYYGDDSDSFPFDKKGVIFFKTLQELETIMNNLNSDTDYYQIPLSSLDYNYKMAMEYGDVGRTSGQAIQKYFNS